MPDTLFKQVNYDLDSLVKFIELGQIGLPDIQRPFVWPNKKVRDLFDSLLRDIEAARALPLQRLNAV